MDELADEMADLTAVEALFSHKLAAVRARKSLLKRRLVEAGEAERLITDHALLRYIQRHKNIDIDALRDELRIIASEAAPAKDGEHHWHKESGLMLIIGDIGQVITVLSPDQTEKWTGRKLKSGEVVAEFRAALKIAKQAFPPST